jgi:MFS family permease
MPVKSFFVQREISSFELPAIMRKHIYTGCMGSVWGNLLTGIVYIYFGNAIGMSHFTWGVLSAVGAWVIVAQPVGAILGERYGSRKRAWFWVTLADRLTRFLGVVGAFLIWRSGNHLAFVFFMVALCLGPLLGNIGIPPWYGWLAMIIPQNLQGTFWGRRDAWISLAVVLIILPAGLLMDLVASSAKLETAVIILSAASFIGFADIFIHRTIPEPPALSRPSGRSFSNILVPLRDRRFRPWLSFAAAWNLTQSLGGALCTLYFMEDLGFKDNLLGGMIAVTATALLAGVATARRGGRAVDRWGVRRVLFISYLFWSIIPLLWLFATPRTGVFWVGLGNVIFGVFSLMGNNAGVKLVTRFPHAAERSMYVAVSNSVASLAAGLGAFAAGSFLRAVGSRSLSIGGLAVGGFPMLFILSAVLRLVSVFTLVPKIPEKRAVPSDRRPMLLPLFFPLPRLGRRMRLGARRRAKPEKPGGGEMGKDP